MATIRERAGIMGVGVCGVLLTLILALVFLFSFSRPGAAAIKRFTDEQGNLHITNESAEGGPAKVTGVTPDSSQGSPSPPQAFPPPFGPKPQATETQEPEAAPPEVEPLQEEPASRLKEAPSPVREQPRAAGPPSRPLLPHHRPPPASKDRGRKYG